MDLNQITAPEPAKTPLRVVRLPRPAGDTNVTTDGFPDPSLVPFQGGEALPESQGQDFPLPISPEEMEALQREGLAPIAVGLVDKGFTNEPSDAELGAWAAENVAVFQPGAASGATNVYRQS